jgi:hypothetical protein
MRYTTKARLSIATAGLAIIAGLTLTASPAQAYPSNCSSYFVANGGAALCGSGYGQVRVVLGCQNWFGFWQNPTGPWVSVGAGASRTGCGLGYFVKWTGYYLR